MYTVIIPCAGNGSRTQLSVNKLLHKVDGLHLIEYTIQHFMYDPDFTEIILAVRSNEKQAFSQFTSNKIKLVEGGATRQDSVYNGLVAATNELIFVHDGNRPMLDETIIQDCKQALSEEQACAVAIPVTDTLTEYTDNHFHLLDRANKFLMQTPQCAYKSLLLSVHHKARNENFIGTDEVSLIKRYSSHNVRLVPGSIMNIKITYSEDFEVFRRLKE